MPSYLTHYQLTPCYHKQNSLRNTFDSNAYCNSKVFYTHTRTEVTIKSLLSTAESIFQNILWNTKFWQRHIRRRQSICSPFITALKITILLLESVALPLPCASLKFLETNILQIFSFVGKGEMVVCCELFFPTGPTDHTWRFWTDSSKSGSRRLYTCTLSHATVVIRQHMRRDCTNCTAVRLHMIRQLTWDGDLSCRSNCHCLVRRNLRVIDW